MCRARRANAEGPAARTVADRTGSAPLPADAAPFSEDVGRTPTGRRAQALREMPSYETWRVDSEFTLDVHNLLDQDSPTCIGEYESADGALEGKAS